MRTSLSILVAGLMFLSGAPVFAQGHGPVPDTGMIAVGASAGASIPSDGRLKNGVEIAANVEGYLTPRVSIRGQLGGTWQDFQGQSFTGTVKPMFFDGNIVYNWEGGAWHPYVTAGAGLYRFRYEETAPGRATVEGSDTAAGFNVGGGFEYFFTRHATMTGEALYHKVGDVNTALAPFSNPSFWTLSLGLKKYF
jgi:hypothetical protein